MAMEFGINEEQKMLKTKDRDFLSTVLLAGVPILSAAGLRNGSKTVIDNQIPCTYYCDKSNTGEDASLRIEMGYPGRMAAEARDA